MKAIILSLLLGALTHCASYTDEVKELRDDYISGKYKNSLDKLEKSSLHDSSTNRLLYHMEKAMILDRMSDRKLARSTLVQADKIVDELYTTSVTKTAASFLINDSVADYEGEDFEKVAIHTELALSFLEDKQVSEARVEAKAINNRLHQITQNYDPKYLHYKEDAFARFMSALIYESLQNWDDAIIDYNQALGVYTSPEYAKFFDGAVPEVLVTSLYGLAKKRNRSQILSDLKKRFPNILEKYDAQIRQIPEGGDVVIFHETGHITTKKEKDFFLPIAGQIIRFSFPVIDKQSIDWMNTLTGLTVNGRYYAASNAVNLNAIAYQCLEDRRGRIIAKSMARLVAKGVLTREAQEHFGLLGGIVANIFSAATETADTRSWTLLPQAFYVNRVRLAPGKHTLEVKTASRVNDVKALTIQAGDLHLLRSKG